MSGKRWYRWGRSLDCYTELRVYHLDDSFKVLQFFYNGIHAIAPRRSLCRLPSTPPPLPGAITSSTRSPRGEPPIGVRLKCDRVQRQDGLPESRVVYRVRSSGMGLNTQSSTIHMCEFVGGVRFSNCVVVLSLLATFLPRVGGHYPDTHQSRVHRDSGCTPCESPQQSGMRPEIAKCMQQPKTLQHRVTMDK